eukprot:jgi/Mesvir1/8066/Mv10518-RA.1
MTNSVASFVIVSNDSHPIFSATLGTAQKKEESAYLHQFIFHASLDVVQEAVWGTNSGYLKIVDKFYEMFVSAYVTAGHAKFLLLHDVRNEDGIKSFFQDVHDLYLKIILNPFHLPTSKITSPAFEQRVRSLAKKYL